MGQEGCYRKWTARIRANRQIVVDVLYMMFHVHRFEARLIRFVHCLSVIPVLPAPCSQLTAHWYPFFLETSSILHTRILPLYYLRKHRRTEKITSVTAVPLSPSIMRVTMNTVTLNTAYLAFLLCYVCCPKSFSFKYFTAFVSRSLHVVLLHVYIYFPLTSLVASPWTTN